MSVDEPPFMTKAARDKKIIELWQQGFSARQISAAVGITAKAVIARVYRLRELGVDVERRPR